MIRFVFATCLSLVLFAAPGVASTPSLTSTTPVVTAQSELTSTGDAAVDAAVEAYSAASAAWSAADEAGKAEAEEARTAAKADAVAAIDAALGVDSISSDRREALETVRLEITGEMRDASALLNYFQKQVASLKDWVIESAPGLAIKLVVILILFFVFKIVAGIVAQLAKKALSTPKIKASSLLKDFIVGIVRKLVMAVGLLVILAQLGIDIAPILAGLGVAGFVLGFALQDTLANFAAGLMILFYRPYDVGDVVTAGGVTGSVDAMSLVSTTVKTPDNQRLIVPNSAIWGGVIQNVTANPTRRVDLVFGIGYDDDMAKAEGILAELVEKHDKCLADPAPNIRVHELADSSVNFIVRPWAKTSDYWDVYWDLTRQVKEAFDREGISIPYPQQDVHMHQVGEQA